MAEIDPSPLDLSLLLFRGFQDDTKVLALCQCESRTVQKAVVSWRSGWLYLRSNIVCGWAAVVGLQQMALFVAVVIRCFVILVFRLAIGKLALSNVADQVR